MDVDPNLEDDGAAVAKFVATKTERLVFTWPIRYTHDLHMAHQVYVRMYLEYLVYIELREIQN